MESNGKLPHKADLPEELGHKLENGDGVLYLTLLLQQIKEVLRTSKGFGFFHSKTEFLHFGPMTKIATPYISYTFI